MPQPQDTGSGEPWREPARVLTTTISSGVMGVADAIQLGLHIGGVHHIAVGDVPEVELHTAVGQVFVPEAGEEGLDLRAGVLVREAPDPGREGRGV